MLLFVSFYVINSAVGQNLDLGQCHKTKKNREIVVMCSDAAAMKNSRSVVRETMTPTITLVSSL